MLQPQPFLRAFCGIALLTLGSTTRAVAQYRLEASTTSLSSTAVRMISYRFQEHMWRTADGAWHLIINRGAYSPGAPLVLHSSHDGGQTWQVMHCFPGLNLAATADGTLLGQVLTVVYNDTAHSIRMVRLTYETDGRRWLCGEDQVVATGGLVTRQSPAVVSDQTGRLWCNYVARDDAVGRAAIRLAVRPSVTGSCWSDTGQEFGPIDDRSLTVQRSGRPLAITEGLGLVFTVHNTFYWAQRSNGADVSAPWHTVQLFTSCPPSDLDPYESHFSVASDSFGNLHLATIDQGNVVYSRLRAGSGQWLPFHKVPGGEHAHYVEVGSSSTAVFLVADQPNRTLRVLQSSDQGATFVRTHDLAHDTLPRRPGIVDAFPRIEMPARTYGSLPILQRYRDGVDSRLLLFTIPLR